MDLDRYFDLEWGRYGAGFGAIWFGIKMSTTGFPEGVENPWIMLVLLPATGFVLCGVGAVIMRPINRAGDRMASRLAQAILRRLEPILRLLYRAPPRTRVAPSLKQLSERQADLDWD